MLETLTGELKKRQADESVDTLIIESLDREVVREATMASLDAEEDELTEEELEELLDEIPETELEEALTESTVTVINHLGETDQMELLPFTESFIPDTEIV